MHIHQVIDPGFDSTLVQRFWRKVAKAGDDECWLWTASVNNRGYGTIGARQPDGRMIPSKAHRVAYVLANGPIDPRLCVLHRCDNPPCVNPSHLFIGTYADNAQDMVAKGRDIERRQRTALTHTGRRASLETREKMRAAKLGAKHWRARAVTINGIRYDCIRDAARVMRVSEAAVRNWVKQGKAVAIEGEMGIPALPVPA